MFTKFQDKEIGQPKGRKGGKMVLTRFSRRERKFSLDKVRKVGIERRPVVGRL